MTILPFTKTQPKYPPGRMCRMIMRTAVFRHANDTIDSLSIIVENIRTDEIDSMLAGFRERGGFTVPDQATGLAKWIPWPVACVDVELMPSPTTGDPVKK
jgi:hypothetical protein